MFLVKCKCGAIYTLDESLIDADSRTRTCPNCRANHKISSDNSIKTMSYTDMQMYRIPESSKIVIQLTPTCSPNLTVETELSQ